MEKENKPDYGYSHVCGYNKMNKEALPFSALSLNVNVGWRGGGSPKCQGFQFDSLNNSNNNNLCLNIWQFQYFPLFHLHWELLEKRRFVLSAKGIMV